MRNYFIALLLLVSFIGSESVEAAKLHAVLIGDTTDLSLGACMEENLNGMHLELKKIADATGLSLNEIVIKDKKVKRKNLVNAVENLKLNKDDVVLLYCSMHGYRTPSKDQNNPWPNLYFTLEDIGVDLEYLNEIIRNKKPRLFIAMADTCNSYVPDGMVPTLEKRMVNRFSTDPALLKENYRRLFLRTSGVIIMSGSIPGQYSYGVQGVGSFLTLAFMKSLQDAVADENEPSWEHLLASTSDEVANYCQPHGIEQTPQYVLNY